MKAITKAVALIGGQTKTGRLLGVNQQRVSSWVNENERAPAKHIKRLSELTNGEVTIEQLLADHENNNKKEVAA